MPTSFLDNAPTQKGAHGGRVGAGQCCQSLLVIVVVVVVVVLVVLAVLDVYSALTCNAAHKHCNLRMLADIYLWRALYDPLRCCLPVRGTFNQIAGCGRIKKGHVKAC